MIAEKNNVCWLLSLYIHACNPKWVLNAARQSYCNSWIYSLSLNKYKPLTPPCDSTFTQKIESDFLQGPAPTFIHLPPSVPIHSAFVPIIRVEPSYLFSPTLEYCFGKFLPSSTFPTGSFLSEYKHDLIFPILKIKTKAHKQKAPRIYFTQLTILLYDKTLLQHFRYLLSPCLYPFSPLFFLEKPLKSVSHPYFL